MSLWLDAMYYCDIDHFGIFRWCTQTLSLTLSIWLVPMYNFVTSTNLMTFTMLSTNLVSFFVKLIELMFANSSSDSVTMTIGPMFYCDVDQFGSISFVIYQFGIFLWYLPVWYRVDFRKLFVWLCLFTQFLILIIKQLVVFLICFYILFAVCINYQFMFLLKSIFFFMS